MSQTGLAEAVGLTFQPIQKYEKGANRNQLYKWAAQVDRHGEACFGGPGRKTKTDEDEVVRLRQELARVKEERDILKKAAVYFARELP